MRLRKLQKDYKKNKPREITLRKMLLRDLRVLLLTMHFHQMIVLAQQIVTYNVA
jgi:hypothetical protein